MRNPNKMSKFSQWMADQEKNDESKSDSHSQSSFPYFNNVFSQLSSIQDNVTSQFQDLSNSLPEAGNNYCYLQKLTN